MDQIQQESREWTSITMFERLLKSYKSNWELLFQLGSVGYSLEKPLTQKILGDSTNLITKLILYLYTMESFIYANLNKASRNKDTRAIKFYGAFAAALSFIIDNANRNRIQNKSMKQSNLFFRGLKMEPGEVDVY